jgi:DNA polymerase-3 subunit delta
VVEAGDLGGSAPLRKLVEAAANGAAIGCYPDGPAEIAQLIRDTARGQRVRIAEDAVEYLVQNLGSDRLVTRQELDKLMLFAGDGGSVSLDDAVASVGDSSALAVEDVVYDAFDGAAAAAEAGLSRLFLEGESPVAILRAAQRQAQRLHLSAARIAAGEPADAVLRGLRLYFKQAPRFKAQLEKWPSARIARALPLLTQAELDCKTTGYPDETMCRHVLAGIARVAQARR